MSDSITVRVTCDSYDVVHPSEKQTQVYVQIPEVARATWLLPAADYEGLRDSKWGDVLDEAITHFEYRTRQGWVTDPATAAARQTVRDWLAVDENRDALDDAWFLDAARRHPVSRTLLRMVTQLGEQLTELQAAQAKCQQDHQPQPFVPRTEREYWVGIAGALNAAHGAGMPVGIDLDGTLTDHRMWSVVWDRAAEQWTVAGYDDDAPAVEETPLTVFRTSYDEGEMGLFATREAARAQCLAHERTRWRGHTAITFKWVPDDNEENSPEELWASLAGDADGSETGYVVTPLTVPSVYDEEADE